MTFLSINFTFTFISSFVIKSNMSMFVYSRRKKKRSVQKWIYEWNIINWNHSSTFTFLACQRYDSIVREVHKKGRWLSWKNRKQNFKPSYYFFKGYLKKEKEKVRRNKRPLKGHNLTFKWLKATFLFFIQFYQHIRLIYSWYIFPRKLVPSTTWEIQTSSWNLYISLSLSLSLSFFLFLYPHDASHSLTHSHSPSSSSKS